MRDLAEGVIAGERRAVARALSVVERGGAESRALLKSIFPKTGQAHVVGITGAPGVGKSTLVDALARQARTEGLTVGIIAVDPSSPFSGGAILGDRIRMQDSTMDPGVFMRSLASRGQTGGLSKATAGSLEILDAAGFSMIVVETVGAGQSEIEVMALADTVAVVLAPGLGDDIQAIKAGILEIADLFVVNKADREGADHTVREIRGMLHLAGETPAWPPMILKTNAMTDEGVPALLDALGRHREFLDKSGTFHARRRRQAELLVRQAITELAEALLARHKSGPEWDSTLSQILSGRIDPMEAAEDILEAAAAHRP